MLKVPDLNICCVKIANQKQSFMGTSLLEFHEVEILHCKG